MIEIIKNLFLSFSIEAENGRCVLKIVNMSDRPIVIGENALPRTNAPGHGIGMAFLMEFAKKYNAHVEVSQKNGYVQVSVEWEDNFPQKAMP